MRDEWLTYEQAADLLGCHPSRLPKLARRGELKTRKQLVGRQSRFGTFRRTDVERIAEADARLEAERAEKAAAREEATRLRQPPDDEHEWITPPDAARQLGLTRQAVVARIRRERLPATNVGGYWWIRQDQLTLIEAGRLGTKTRRV